MIREIKHIPELPIIQEYIVEQESTTNDDSLVDWK